MGVILNNFLDLNRKIPIFNLRSLDHYNNQKHTQSFKLPFFRTANTQNL